MSAFRWAGVVLAFCLAAPRVTQAQATAPVDSALTFHPTYVRASLDLFQETPSDTDSVTVLVVGMVTGGRFPIEGLPTGQPGVEVTFVISDLSYVTWGFRYPKVCQSPDFSYQFEDGWFRVYADDSPDADLADPASFQDGELLLEGTMRSYDTGLVSSYGCTVHNDGWVTFTGGSLFSSVSKDGVGYEALFIHRQDQTTDPVRSLGYQWYGDGRLTLSIPVAVRPTTWGRLKALYR
jgi:hypothetical protein